MGLYNHALKIMARNSVHYVRTGLDVVSAVYIDIQSKKFMFYVFYDYMRVWYKIHYTLRINDLS